MSITRIRIRLFDLHFRGERCTNQFERMHYAVSNSHITGAKKLQGEKERIDIRACIKSTDTQRTIYHLDRLKWRSDTQAGVQLLIWWIVVALCRICLSECLDPFPLHIWLPFHLWAFNSDCRLVAFQWVYLYTERDYSLAHTHSPHTYNEKFT